VCQVDPLLLALSCVRFYIDLQYLGTLKYVYKLIKFILKLLVFSEGYLIILYKCKKLSLQQTLEAHMVVRRRGYRIF
jgi:hypothetical protein